MNTKERATVNAALVIIHDAGRDVGAVQRQASSAIARGQAPFAAYKGALGAFVKANPDTAAVLTRTARLIEASDGPTVERYDKALSAYISTGDDSHVTTLESMVRADSVALAVKGGEVSAADAAAGRVDWEAIGLNAPAPSSAPQQFSFSGSSPVQAATSASAPANAPTASPADDGRHWSFTGGGTGVRSAKATARFGASPVPVTSRPSPYAGMAPAQVRDAMRSDATAPRGWVDRPTEA